MEKNAARTAPVIKRLLSSVYFFFCIALSYAAVQDSITVTCNGNIFTINDEIHIEAVIQKKSSYIRKWGIPHFLIDIPQETASLQADRTVVEGNSIVMTAIYRLRKGGRLTIKPVLQWRRQNLPLEPFSITVHQQPLSEKTPFSWLLIDPVLKQIVPVSFSIKQGRLYYAVLTGSFYVPDQNEFQMGLLEPLPSGIHRIRCTLPEDALLERIFPKEPLLEYAEELNDRHIIAVFEWIPLSAGMRSLPVADIHLTGGIAVSAEAASYMVQPETPVLHTSASLQDVSYTAEAFAKVKETAPIHPQNIQDDTSKAHQIVEYRRQEISGLFPYRAYKERRNLEKSLHIEHALPVYHRIVWITAFGASILFIVSAGMAALKRHILKAVVLCVIVFLCITAAILSCRANCRLQAVCISNQRSHCIRRIPDMSGQQLHLPAIGESVFILQETAEWYYIATAGNLSGWIPKEAVRLVVPK